MNRGLGQNGYAEVGDSAEVSADSALPQTLTPALSHPPVGERETATLTPDPLELIAEGKHSIEAVCIESGMSILELAAHVCTPRNLEALTRVAQLHALEREMLLGRLKRDALMRLRELTEEVPAANADEIRAAEVMRKACVDLLRYGGGTTCNTSPRQTQSLPPLTDTLSPASEAEILEALERLGQEDGEEEVYPQIEDSPACPPGRGRITQIAQVKDSPGRMNREENENGNENEYEHRVRESGSVTPESHPPPETVTLRARTRRVPLSIRSTQNRTPNNNTRTLPEDAHPP